MKNIELKSLKDFETLNQEKLSIIQGGFHDPISELGDPDRPSRKIDHVGPPKYA
ncbi:hypothetical protein M0D21_15815 [Aquimarina sp. D1M17]|uniref:hypothetical protein n=1 Tax=Aquimarina acroporae TaxID=2937283 RepID=UPI0020BD6C22|nr:hypothetical protein [Aquimarina acroporae]MCK8523045.1 hypothetical protein [Aquimarina acroporae]